MGDKTALAKRLVQECKPFDISAKEVMSAVDVAWEEWGQFREKKIFIKRNRNTSIYQTT